MTPDPYLPDGSPVGWTVTDPDGNVIESGPQIHLELAVTELLEGM